MRPTPRLKVGQLQLQGGLWKVRPTDMCHLLPTNAAFHHAKHIAGLLEPKHITDLSTLSPLTC